VTALEVRRDDLHRTRLVDDPAPEPGPGQALVRVDRFGITANNITYGILGDGLSYWTFFPAADGWGRIPVWGFAEVVASATDALAPGARLFGYCPMAGHLLLRPTHVDADWVVDGSPHRAALPGTYNRYRRVETDPAYAAEREDQQIVLRPLFFLSFTLDDFLAANDLFGAEAVVLASASSKSALGAAFLLRRRGIPVLGLTSPAKRAFVEGVGVYEAVATYDDVDALPDRPVAFADLAGSAEVRAAVHRRYGDRLTHSAVAGATHQDATPSGDDLPGPAPTFFFVPERLRTRTREWGAEAVQERANEAWTPYVDWCDEWLGIERRSGPESVQETYAAVLDGAVAPDRAYVLGGL
jgi:NADPH:quinone reductase-like Zn-dependent oxidoreductase